MTDTKSHQDTETPKQQKVAFIVDGFLVLIVNRFTAVEPQTLVGNRDFKTSCALASKRAVKYELKA